MSRFVVRTDELNRPRTHPEARRAQPDAVGGTCPAPLVETGRCSKPSGLASVVLSKNFWFRHPAPENSVRQRNSIVRRSWSSEAPGASRLRPRGEVPRGQRKERCARRIEKSRTRGELRPRHFSIEWDAIIEADMKCGDPNNPAGPYITASGKPCGRDVRPGFTRCNLHGGNAPASKIKAEQLMAQARMPAIEALYTILDQFSNSTCPTCGFPTGDTDEKRMIVRTCQTILDRCGMGPHATLEIARQTDGDIDLNALMPEERGQLLALLAQIKEIKTAVKQRQQQALSNPSTGLADNPRAKDAAIH